MRPLGSGNTMFAILQNKMGADFNEKLAEQKPVFSRDMRNDARRVARGEYPIYIPQIFAFASDLKGLPVKVVVPKEGAPYAQMDIGDAEERAASERRAAVHPAFPRASNSQLIYANAWMLPVVQAAAERADAGCAAVRERQADGPGEACRASGR